MIDVKWSVMGVCCHRILISKNMNNICDDDDDDMMNFLIHDREDEFTEAIVLIVDNLAKEAADGGDDTTLVPPFVLCSGSRVGKLQTSNVVDDFWDPSPIYDATYFKKKNQTSNLTCCRGTQY